MQMLVGFFLVLGVKFYRLASGFFLPMREYQLPSPAMEPHNNIP